jgi:hypothetical protein
MGRGQGNIRGRARTVVERNSSVRIFIKSAKVGGIYGRCKKLTSRIHGNSRGVPGSIMSIKVSKE